MNVQDVIDYRRCSAHACKVWSSAVKAVAVEVEESNSACCTTRTTLVMWTCVETLALVGLPSARGP